VNMMKFGKFSRLCFLTLLGITVNGGAKLVH